MPFDIYKRDIVSTTAGATLPTPSQTLTFAAAQTCNFDVAPFAVVTLTSNLTSLTLSGGVAGGVYGIKIAQDATGSRTLSGAAATIIWQGTTLYGTTHSAPTLTTTVSKYDTFFFMCDGTNYVEITRTMGI